MGLGIIGRIPRQVAVRLSIFAAWDLDEEDEVDLVGSVWPEGLSVCCKVESPNGRGGEISTIY